jgi:hypothetical protein
MIKRLTLTLAALLIAMTALAPAAYAKAAVIADLPAPDAETVSKVYTSGLEAVAMVKGVDVGPKQLTVTFRKSAGTEPITVNYGDLLDKSPAATGAGTAAGAYVALRILGRIARMVKMLMGLGGGAAA